LLVERVSVKIFNASYRVAALGARLCNRYFVAPVPAVVVAGRMEPVTKVRTEHNLIDNVALCVFDEL
jgi:hypothetical protein